MDVIARKMKERGLRFTSQKKEILCVLQKKPQTILEIYARLKEKKCMVDKATVYRALTSFVGLGIARQIALGDREARFELFNCKHHHHLVCEGCGDIQDIEVDEHTILNEANKNKTFKIKRHTLEFFGLCSKCQ